MHKVYGQIEDDESDEEVSIFFFNVCWLCVYARMLALLSFSFVCMLSPCRILQLSIV